MEYNKPYLVPNPVTPNAAIVFDPEVCDGCNKCIDFCRTDVLMPNPEPGKPPIVAYPDECWFGGCCVGACPNPGANRMDHPLNQRATWKRKETGEFFRIGMKNLPPPNRKPPVVD
jgi:Ferredoxin